MIKIYNSLTKQLEEFVPLTPNKVMMYVCGPTVYNYMHIGNARPKIFFDVVARFFKYMGYELMFVSNYTDIDDKIINKARQLKISEEEVSEKYIKIIEQTCDRMNLLKHNYNPRVTENLDEIINFIKKLVDKGDAYVVDGDVYFNVIKYKSYGVLSGQILEEMVATSRVKARNVKLNPGDFALWKKTNVGKKFSSPFGEGRPGWHTECVVMIDRIFKGKIDIHGGGADLKFPHHENEIVQSEALFNHSIANIWMHNGMLDMSGEKMSKSLGNVVWVHELLDKYPYQAIKLFFINSPYSQPINFTNELMTSYLNEYKKIENTYKILLRKLELEVETLEVEFSVDEVIKYRSDFIESMSNDFNTTNALTILYSVLKNVNICLRTDTDINILLNYYKLINEILYVFGIGIDINLLTTKDKALYRSWIKARNIKDYSLADEIRIKLIKKGII